jgi:hypothetical protein
VGKSKRLIARLLCGLLIGALLGMSAVACGGTRAGTRSTTSSPPTTTEARFTTTTTSLIPSGQALRGDGDADNPNDIDGNGDSDRFSPGGTDGDSDSPTRASYDLPDHDDKPTYAFGNRPDAATTGAIATLVKRYYAAASAGDGSAACAMMTPSFARAVPEDYGSSYAGYKTCPAIMSLLFKQARQQLAEPITVLKVRVNGSTGQAIFSSRKMPASSIFLARQGGSWKVVQLIGSPLP